MSKPVHSSDLSDAEWAILAPLIPPAKPGVYSYYRKWQRKGLWEQFNHTLRTQVREQMGKSPQPTAIAADRQSVKTAEKRGRCMALMAVRG